MSEERQAMCGRSADRVESAWRPGRHGEGPGRGRGHGTVRFLCWPG